MKTFLLILLSTLVFSCSACKSPKIAHGLNSEEWLLMLNKKENLPFSVNDKIEFKAIASFGPGALFFTGMRAEEALDDSLALVLYKNAASLEEGIYKEKAAIKTAELLLNNNNGEDLLKFVRGHDFSVLEAEEKLLWEAKALFLQKKYKQLIPIVDNIRSEYLDFYNKNKLELDGIYIPALYQTKNPEWKNEFLSLLHEKTSSNLNIALTTIIDFFSEISDAEFEDSFAEIGSEQYYLLEARYNSSKKEYGKAVKSFRKFAIAYSKQDFQLADAPLDFQLWEASLSTIPEYCISDLGRSFLSASVDEGKEIFAYLFNNIDVKTSDKNVRGFYSSFWNGRFLRLSTLNPEKLERAEKCFALAAVFASQYDKAGADYDTAAWYGIDLAKKRSVNKGLDLLEIALNETKNPSWYSDVIEELSRAALIARDSKTLMRLESIVSHSKKGSVEDIARMAYIAARCSEIGIIKEKDIIGGNKAEFIKTCYEIAYASSEDSWYRILAAYRLNKELFVPLAEDVAPVIVDENKEYANKLNEFALAMIKYGFASYVRKYFGDDLRFLSSETIQNAAQNLAFNQKPDLSYRTIAVLFWRDGFVPTRAEAELYWPRPYEEYFLRYSADQNVDEYLLYGIARTESAFQHDAVSRSGAIGLIQLMPPTAAEMAERLKIDNYDLTNPEENLLLGSYYFSRVYKSRNERVLPAVCSYNAGPARFKRWETSFGPLPSDLLLETLSYAETRQYGKSVLGAAMMYQALYGSGNVRDYANWLLGED